MKELKDKWCCFKILIVTSVDLFDFHYFHMIVQCELIHNNYLSLHSGSFVPRPRFGCQLVMEL